MTRRTKVLRGGGGFGVVVTTALALATGSAQVGLHAGFWLSVVFTVWLESRIPE